LPFASSHLGIVASTPHLGLTWNRPCANERLTAPSGHEWNAMCSVWSQSAHSVDVWHSVRSRSGRQEPGARRGDPP
jgi:hypothetical protein